MTNRKQLFWATTALMSGLLMAGAASAQSTGTEATEVSDVVVTGQRGPRNIEGLAVAETVAKTRNTINQEFIATQGAGQTILQVLNLTPGLSFTNADPYGSSGGNIRLRGFDGNRVSLTFDGIPLNDTGNYASYTNQQMDPELIERASVNTGSTDVDSPTASATGGTINYVTRRPAADFGGWVQGSLGDFNYRRVMGLIDTGEVGPWGTSAWFAASYQDYDKFKGIGNLEKAQYNARIYQPLGDNGDFISLAGHYNVNKNYNYNGPNLATATGFCDVAKTQVCKSDVETSPFGWGVDFDRTYTAPTVRAGVADVDSNSANYWGLRINPSNTGNIRGTSRFTLRDGLTLTVDPSFQYTLAAGGSQQTVLSETDALLRGTKTTGGVDLNGDGDTLDRVRVHTPSVTNTHRYGLNSSLIWDLNENHRLRAAYALDWGRHRQTGNYGFIDFSNPSNPTFVDDFGGRNEEDNRVVNLDGFALQARNRKSIASLNQFSAEYRGRFLQEALTVTLGVRAPFFERELNQYCYTQNASSNVVCTTEVPNATLANGNVTFASKGGTQYIKPFQRTVKFDDILPNVGATYRFGEGQSVFGSYSESLSAPRTDSLYSTTRLADGSLGNPTVQPETSKNLDLGYRYTTSTIVAQLSVFQNQFDNRIVSTFDSDLDQFVDRNVGSVETVGFEGSIGWSPIEQLSLYGTVSLLNSELQDDYVYDRNGNRLPTKGKKQVETPEQMFSLRASYKFNDVFSAGVQGKYTGERWVTDVNDLKVDAYTVVDMDARFDFSTLGLEGTYLQVNVTNLFDEQYYSSIGSRASATPGQLGYSRPFANVGAPRTIMASLRYSF
ncbi:iron complex outermembrane receptor protein [Brevundimonas bullata]|uniref:Iron complex outermembrane receptor protein n=1 Tax=Brevundimonas bullata TaxID=13160 RepID=A0A7W7IPL5_9CAUL|nr:TonB-dependent receptor [Brevundimonas bullata]MBB4798160.1 iron complex outermembrane receptor protein [Brevundimonas bullata]MBB6383526.1 iron complex outermembrane receptor protein [Brevundimonas bullata]